MIILDTTTALLRLITSGTAGIDSGVHFADHDYTGGTPATEFFRSGMQPTLITTATTTTICASPASATIDRNIKHVLLRNVHASAANTLTLFHTNGTTTTNGPTFTLAAGEWAIFDANGVLFIYDVNGCVKMGASAASDTVAGLIMLATQADMETGTDVLKAVTPGRQHFHPSAAKWWAKVGLTGNVLASYNTTSVADTGTGAITPTIATDFSSVHWCAGGIIELASTVIAQSCTYDSMAAGTIIFRSVVEAGSATDPVTWSVFGFGDL